MSIVRVAHTGELDAVTLEAARTLLAAVFEGELTEQDWEHCLGGLHALAWEGDELIGHAALIQRRLLHEGRALRAGYIEGVGVRGDRRRQGHGGTMMEALERLLPRAYDLGALGTSDDGIAFYRARGWQAWEGPTSALTPEGKVRTEAEDGYIYVFELAVPLDLSAELTCDWRDGDVW